MWHERLELAAIVAVWAVIMEAITHKLNPRAWLVPGDSLAPFGVLRYELEWPIKEPLEVVRMHRSQMP